MAWRKSLPHNTEAEKSVLGAMIRSIEKRHEGFGLLDVSDFYEKNENHRAIFSAMVRIDKRGEPIDAQSIINELINANELDVAGGPEYLSELVDSSITFSNFKNYVQMVLDQALLRKFLVTISNIENEYYTKDIQDVTTFLGNSGHLLDEITEKRRVGDFESASQLAKNVQKEIDDIKEASTVTGTPTGFQKLDIITHGFQKGSFIVMAARPGVGKTALALNFAYNAALRDRPVAYFSLEMPSNQLVKRIIAGEANVDFSDLLTGYNLNKANVRLRIKEACDKFSKIKFYVDGTSGIPLNDLIAKVRTLYNREPDLSLVIVDYIGLITTNLSKQNSNVPRQLEMQLISQSLKKLALELNIPIIGVAQLNRKVEDRQSGEPQASDLRESGSLEQDADLILLLHEPKISDAKDSKNIFEKNTKEVDAAQDKVAKRDGGKNACIVNVNIAKHRNGRCGNVPLLFRKNVCKFDSPSREAEEELDNLNNERLNYYSSN